MSKVKIQGNASGTGVLTVTAPNTSTDRVITLPDATDTLAVNSDVTNKLPLAGGTLTGNLIAGGEIKVGTSDNGKITSTFALSLDPPTGEPILFRTAGTDIARFRPGGGLCFGTDTAAANTLDDYEEGTYTPVFKDTSNASMTGILLNAIYTKIGRLVTVHVYYEISNSQNGNLNTMTLPFNQAGSGRGAGSITTYACPHANQSNDIYLNGGSQVAFWQVRDNGTSIAMAVDNGSELIMSLTYMTS
jgi:hypothetical protein